MKHFFDVGANQGQTFFDYLLKTEIVKELTEANLKIEGWPY